MAKENEESGVKIDMQEPEETEKDTGHRTRLFDTL
jgi:hypothetical protein